MRKRAYTDQVTEEMEMARVAESGIVDGDRGEVKYDVPAGYVD